MTLHPSQHDTCLMIEVIILPALWLDAIQDRQMSSKDFELLCQQLQSCAASEKIEILERATEQHFVTSLQGNRAVGIMDNSFDKVIRLIPRPEQRQIPVRNSV